MREQVACCLVFLAYVLLTKPGTTDARQLISKVGETGVLEAAQFLSNDASVARPVSFSSGFGIGVVDEPRGRLVYSDDFSDPKSGWTVSADAEISYNYVDGEYQIIVTEEFEAAAVAGGAQLKDYVVEVDVRCVTDRSGVFGLSFGVDFDGTETYVFSLTDRSSILYGNTWMVG